MRNNNQKENFIEEERAMDQILKNVIQKRKEHIIDQLLKFESYKSLDGRQLYELTLKELEFEYKNKCK